MPTTRAHSGSDSTFGGTIGFDDDGEPDAGKHCGRADHEFCGDGVGTAGATVAPTGLLEVFDNGNELWQYSLTPSASARKRR